MEQILGMLKKLSEIVPVEWYVFIGSMLEEIVAPIPSPLVLTSAGSIAESIGKNYSFLFLLALIAGVAKTIGGYIYYMIADKAEDIVLGKFGKYMGISHKSVEHLGKHLNGSKRDFFILFVLRALPVVPSSPVSVLCGVIKMDMKVFLAATFIGDILRAFFFLYLGYTGTATLAHGLESVESVVTLIIAVLIAALIGYSYLYRKKLHRKSEN